VKKMVEFSEHLWQTFSSELLHLSTMVKHISYVHELSFRLYFCTLRRKTNQK